MAEREVPLPALRVAKVADQLKVDKPYTLKIPSRQEWEENRVDLPQEALMCYTDGSRMTEARSAGAGVKLESHDKRVSYPLGKHITVFQAEVFTIMMAASMEEIQDSEVSKVCIASDSQSALKAISKPRASSALVQEYGDTLERLSETKEDEIAVNAAKALDNLIPKKSKDLHDKEYERTCREKRDTEENGTKPEITKLATDNVVSLIDIEKGESTTKSEKEKTPDVQQGNPKAKRCSRGIVGASNPIIGAFRNKLKSFSLSKRDSETGDETLCTACVNQATCRLLGKCAECNKFCKGIATYTDDLLTPWTNQTVGMSNRMASKKDDIFSKTLYPVSTFREGETKEIICRIVGITDTSDIETVTIWITTFSNRPPSSLNGLYSDSPKKVESTPEQSLRKSETPSPELKPRFNNDDEEVNSRSHTPESRRTNPDVIEGPPPFLRNSDMESTEGDNKLNNGEEITGAMHNQPIIVQPKEFQSDESNELNDVDHSSSSTLPNEEPTTSKNILRPTLISKLRDLATARTNKYTNLKARLQELENIVPAKGGFIKNLLKTRHDTVAEKPDEIISSPKLQSVEENNIETNAEDNQNAPIQRPSETEDQMVKINDAIQEVKSMVKNIQDEASKASEKRLLGVSHITDIPKFVDVDSSKVAKQIPQVLPNHVADNIKDVNKYFMNRVQDALDMIGTQENKNQAKAGSVRDEHSELTKSTINNLKKMPQYLLEKYRDSVDGFNKDGTNNAEGDNDSSLDETGGNIVGLSERFKNDDSPEASLEANETDNNLNVETNQLTPINISNKEIVVGAPEQSESEIMNTPNIDTLNIDTTNIDTPTKIYKNKLEKYLAELKEKRQRKYSPEKFLKNSSPKSNILPTETENISLNNDKDNSLLPNNLMLANNIEMQKTLLKERLKSFIEQQSEIKSSTDATNKGGESTPANPPLIDPKYFMNRIQQSSLDNPTLVAAESESNSPVKDIPEQNTDLVVGDTNSIDNNEFPQFLPTIPTLTKKPNEITETTNKFQKYLTEFKEKQSSLFSPKSLVETKSDGMPGIKLDPKKDLLKDKFKKYVENLKKPTGDTLGQPAISLNQRMSEQVSDLNSKLKNDMKNLLSSTNDIFKKDLLKDKLKKYIDSLKKPALPDLMRRSSAAQKEELGALKKRLEELIKPKDPNSLINLEDNPLGSKMEPTEPIMGPSNSDPIDIQSKSGFDDSLGKTEAQKDETVGSTQQIAINNQENTEKLDWSHSLGKIVQSSTQPKDLFFVGTGIKLPLQVIKGEDGTMELSVDLEKLCSCYNSTCPKNHTAIEETVGAILEKEAELNEQLGMTEDDGKIEPLQNNDNSDNKESRMQKLLNNLNSHSQNKRSNVFKRSSDRGRLGEELTTIKNVLKTKQNNNRKDNKNSILKEMDLPELPSLQQVEDEINQFNEKVRNSFKESVQEMKNNAEQIKEQIEDTVLGVSQNLNPNSNQNRVEILNNDNLDNILEKMNDKTLNFNNRLLEKIEHQNNLRNLLRENGLDTDNSPLNLLNNDYLKGIEPNKMINKLIKTNKLDPSNMFTVNPLKQIRNQASETLRNLERQNNLNKYMRKTALKKFQLPYTTAKDPITVMNEVQENLKNSLPTVSDLTNRMNEINDDVLKITDPYQFGRVNVLESKLNQLDNEIKKYHENNEKLLAEESQKLFGGHKNLIIGKEVNIISRILSWLKSLTTNSEQ